MTVAWYTIAGAEEEAFCSRSSFLIYWFFSHLLVSFFHTINLLDWRLYIMYMHEDKETFFIVSFFIFWD